jgi:pSer/pThr/pTyr-binding forkhead associated (FHA) protein
MSELIVTIFKLVFLGLLCLFLLFALFSIRLDIYGVKNKKEPIVKNNNITSQSYKTKKNEPTSLFVLSGKLEGTTIPLVRGEILTIGRVLNANIVIDDQYASNEHAEIFNEDYKWFVVDVGSTNGTFVNDKQIETYEILVGDTIKIGETKFQVN